MSDIFLSYASQDRSRVRPLIHALQRQGWSVWWDRRILPGKSYDQVIEDALQSARCVVVVWSKVSVQSDWVRTEAEAARQRQILVPVLIDSGVHIPLAFSRIQAASLWDWEDTRPHPDFEGFIRAIADLIGSPERPPAQRGKQTEPPPKRRLEEPPPSRQKPEDPKKSQDDRRRRPVWTVKCQLVTAVRAAHVLAQQYRLVWMVWVMACVLTVVLYFALSRRSSSPGPSVLPRTYINNNLRMEFVLISPGEFVMRSPSPEERPRRVRITQPFYLGKYEVTQAQWEGVMKKNPSQFQGDTKPVEMVSWEDVQAFIHQINLREGGTKYRLPTEAEWEYAARAGSTTAYSFGDNVRQLAQYAWCDKYGTNRVGQLKPNAWGLYDMHGNVWEWVRDWYGSYPDRAITDPQGPTSGFLRLLRGGSWYGQADLCQSGYRYKLLPETRYNTIGFRLLRIVP